MINDTTCLSPWCQCVKSGWTCDSFSVTNQLLKLNLYLCIETTLWFSTATFELIWAAAPSLYWINPHTVSLIVCSEKEDPNKFLELGGWAGVSMSCVLNAAVEGWLWATLVQQISAFLVHCWGCTAALSDSLSCPPGTNTPLQQHPIQCPCWHQDKAQDAISGVQGHSLDGGGAAKHRALPPSLASSLSPTFSLTSINASMGPFPCHFPALWLIPSKQLAPPTHRISLDNVLPPRGCLTFCLVALLLHTGVPAPQHPQHIVTIDTLHNSNCNLQGSTLALVNIVMERVIIFQIKASTRILV